MESLIVSDIEKFRVNPCDFKQVISFQLPKRTNRFLVTDVNTGKKYICKKFYKRIKEPNVISSNNIFYREIIGLCQLHHPTIVPFHGFAINIRKFGLTYHEFMERGSLREFIDSNQGELRDQLFDDTRKLIISYGIARSIKYLHSNNVIHQFLNSTNIFLDSELFPHISHFEKKIDLEGNDYFSIEEIYSLSPELFEDFDSFSHSKSINAYGYAMVLYELWTEQRPFPRTTTRAEIVDFVLRGKRPTFQSKCSPSEKWQKLICDCWSQHPQARPTFEQICQVLESEYFAGSCEDKELFDMYKRLIDESEKLAR